MRPNWWRAINTSQNLGSHFRPSSCQVRGVSNHWLSLLSNTWACLMHYVPPRRRDQKPFKTLEDVGRHKLAMRWTSGGRSNICVSMIPHHSWISIPVPCNFFLNFVHMRSFGHSWTLLKKIEKNWQTTAVCVVTKVKEHFMAVEVIKILDMFWARRLKAPSLNIGILKEKVGWCSPLMPIILGLWACPKVWTKRDAWEATRLLRKSIA